MKNNLISKKKMIAFVEKEKQKILKDNDKLLLVGNIGKYQNNTGVLKGLSVVSDYLDNGNF